MSSSVSVVLAVSCRQLRNADFFSKSDPFCVLSKNKSSDVWEEVGRTEVVKNNLDPEWTTTFRMKYFPCGGQRLRCDIYDSDGRCEDLKKHDFLGTKEFLLDAALTSPDQKFSAPLDQRQNETAEITVYAEETSTSPESVLFQLKAMDLKNQDLFGKSDPFYVVSRVCLGGRVIKLAQSETLPNESSPLWQPMKFSAVQLCNGDYRQPLKFEVFDEDVAGTSQLIGGFETSLEEMREAFENEDSFFCSHPTRRDSDGNANFGEIQLKSLEFQ